MKSDSSKHLVFILSLLWTSTLLGQVTIKVTNIPSDTPDSSKIYMAGNFNNWDPGQTELKSDNNGNYVTKLDRDTGSIEFKFTRGDWDTAEGDSEGNYLKNRKLTLDDSTNVIKLKIKSWEDLNKESITPRSENVEVLDSIFTITQLNRKRRVWLYLPPDYHGSDKAYPVLYMQDGQNLFDDNESYAGSWRVGQTLDSLFKQGDYGAIVVAVDHGGDKRVDEYTPWINKKYGGGEGDSYMKFIAETLKPYIDQHYRTRSGPEYNALIGSSLGALISTYGGVKYSDTFRKIGALSPAYWITLEELEDYIKESSADLFQTRIYFIAGKNETVEGYEESKTVSQDIEKVSNELNEKGLRPKNIRIQIDADGEHSENYWRREFGKLYKWLFKDLNLQKE